MLLVFAKLASSLLLHRRPCLLAIAGLFWAAPCPAGAAALQPESPPSAAQRSPHDWVVLAAHNELDVITHEGPYLRYRSHVIDGKGDRIRDIIESRDGTVARTIATEGKPLEREADTAERQRLQDLAASPSDFARHTKNDAGAKKIATDLIRLMPDAMLYTPASGFGNAHSPAGGPVVVLDFKPNPHWNPPTTSAEALTGIEGRVWIDASSGYVLRLDADLFRSVNIGWGMLAHIYPGGKMTFEQGNVGGGRWIYSHFSNSARVRALMVKSIDISSEVTASNFQLLPSPLSYQDAIALLLATPAQH